MLGTGIFHIVLEYSLFMLGGQAPVGSLSNSVLMIGPRNLFWNVLGESPMLSIFPYVNIYHKEFIHLWIYL
jgi:hypothetical protein